MATRSMSMSEALQSLSHSERNFGDVVKLRIFNLFILVTLLCVAHIHTGAFLAYAWRSVAILQKQVLSFYCLLLGIQLRLGSKCLYPEPSNWSQVKGLKVGQSTWRITRSYKKGGGRGREKERQ